MHTEKKAGSVSGGIAILVLTALLALSVLLFLIVTPGLGSVGRVWVICTLLLFDLAVLGCYAGLFMLQPNQAAVLTFFGKYR